MMRELDNPMTAIEDVLRRAIECGALVDPWNVLGFGGNFTVFGGLENSVRDHRIDDLLDLMEQIFGLYARLLSEAAAAGDDARRSELRRGLEDLATWWDQFAATTVAGFKSVSGSEALQSASEVADALAAWRDAGEAAGDIAFWRQKIEHFRAPRAYALVVEALLERRDYVASMALLMQWLGQVEDVPLEEGRYSFHRLAERWLTSIFLPSEICGEGEEDLISSADKRWSLTRKFFDFFEANAEEYWTVPEFEFRRAKDAGEADAGQDDAPENLFAAAYEEMSYRDTTDDGVDAPIYDEGGGPTEHELDFETTRLGKRLSLLMTVARLWRPAATATLRDLEESGDDADYRDEREATLHGWFEQARENERRLLQLLEDVEAYEVPPPGNTHDGMLEYDRRRSLKLSLMEKAILTSVETSVAARYLLATTDDRRAATQLDDWERHVVEVMAAMLRGQPAGVRTVFAELSESLSGRPMLYVPLARGGDPQHTLDARSTQQVVRHLLERLPRMGLLRETCRLLAVAQDAEENSPRMPGIVTEFDHLFQIGYAAIVESLVRSSHHWPTAETHSTPI